MKQTEILIYMFAAMIGLVCAGMEIQAQINSQYRKKEIAKIWADNEVYLAKARIAISKEAKKNCFQKEGSTK